MAREQNIKAVLDRFANYIVEQSKENLRPHDASGKLSKSITSEVSTGPVSFSMEIDMEKYGEFLDSGVSGTKKKYDTPYAYTNKMPPPSAFSQWVIKRGLTGVRDKQGRFIKRKSLQFAIAKGIYYNGIKPTNFFTRPFNIAFNNLPQEIVNAFELDRSDFKAFIRKTKNK
tara:strand:+ start:210 stop:722 length:513 start_codon:yes stop_codon:yes gene_type:complete